MLSRRREPISERMVQGSAASSDAAFGALYEASVV